MPNPIYRRSPPRSALGGAWDWLVGPSDVEKRQFSLLTADWARFQRDGVPDKFPHLRPYHNRWIAFERAWLAEERRDSAELNGMIADANTVRAYLAEKIPAYRREAPAQGVEEGQKGGLAKRAAEHLDRGARVATEEAPKNFWDALPWQVKIAIFAGAILYGLKQIATIRRGAGS